jgi:outer membrane lipoprotein-sorting protein
MEDVVGLDLNKLSEEELKQLDGENVAARQVDEGAAPSDVQTAWFDKRQAEPSDVQTAWFDKRQAGPSDVQTAWFDKRQAEPSDVQTAWFDKRQAGPSDVQTAWFDKRQAGPSDVQTAWFDKREAAPSETHYPTLARREADALPQTRINIPREAAPQITNIIPREEVDPTKGPGPITAREAAPQTTNIIPRSGNDKREALRKDDLNADGNLIWMISDIPESKMAAKRTADAADPWDGPAPTPNEPQAAPQPEFISGIVAREYVHNTKDAEPTNKPVGKHANHAREAAPQETAKHAAPIVGWVIPGNEKREAALQEPAKRAAPIAGWVTSNREKRDIAAPTKGDPAPTEADPHPVTKREAAPSGFYTSTLLRARADDDEDINVTPPPATPPTPAGPTPPVRARDDIYLDPAAPPTYGGPTPRAIDVANENEGAILEKKDPQITPKGSWTTIGR